MLGIYFHSTLNICLFLYNFHRDLSSRRFPGESMREFVPRLEQDGCELLLNFLKVSPSFSPHLLASQIIALPEFSKLTFLR